LSVGAALFSLARRRGIVALLLALLVGACAMTVHPLDDAGNGFVVHAPEDSQPRGVILALHGFNDHRHAFDGFAAFAAARGYRVEAFDQQGFGANRNRGLWPGNQALASDTRDRLETLRRRWPEVPIYVLGESMGAAVAVLALAGTEPLADGLIMAAPAVWGGASFNPLYRVLLMATASLLPRRLVTGRGLGVRASDNDAALIALGQDPMVIKATRLDAIAGLVRLMDEAVSAGPELELPVLVLSGERDEVIPPAAVEAFVARLPAEPCRYVRYREGWHLLLRDRQRRRVWTDIVRWLDGRGIADAEHCAGLRRAIPISAVPSSR